MIINGISEMQFQSPQQFKQIQQYANSRNN